MDDARRHPGQVTPRGSADALDALPAATWAVLHDVAWPGRAEATIDHVAIGPTGVYVIDAHGESGCDAGRAAQAASALAPAVARITCQQPVPVLCLPRRTGITGWAGDVLVCSTANVDYLLRWRATILTSDQVDEAAEVLAGGGTAGLRGVMEPTAPAAPEPAVRRPASGERGPASRGPRARARLLLATAAGHRSA